MPRSTRISTVWQSLDEWAHALAPWQRRILAYATRGGTLKPEQIGEVYELFSEDASLREKRARKEVMLDVLGRPASALTQTLRLHRVDNVVGVNALPDGCAIEFGPGLTVIYGRNGAGKTGFARILANACFSRHKPEIVPNIYAGAAQSATAQIHLVVDGEAKPPLTFDRDTDHPELRRISFFDSAVARLHVSEASPFEFKPAGFDVFPEMARVYGELGLRLDADIEKRPYEFNFSTSFIGAETEVSRAVAALSEASDLAALRSLGTYGPKEKARLEEVDKQLSALKAKSAKEILVALQQARSDLDSLSGRIESIGKALNPDNSARRGALATTAKQAFAAAAAMGSEQFKRSFFRAVGTPEWREFTKAAHALSRKEGETYPALSDRCLLCERPLDEQSRAHIAALLAFVEGDAQREARKAMTALDAEVSVVQQLDVNVFSPDSRVREHMHRLDPVAEAAVDEFVKRATQIKADTLTALQAQRAPEGEVDQTEIQKALRAVIKSIDEDRARLEKDDSEKAIASLELERQTIRHKEVLHQLLPAIEKSLTNAAWCRKAQRAKSALNPRHITDKEKELSTAIIGGAYKEKLADECKRLECEVPVEIQTAGHRGKTVRSLSMQGGYQPEHILSEGEQKVVALADFLTEVGLNPANAGIILDDPVNSQDHQRKEKIAERLVDEAKKRQVVVFTHDLPFLNHLIVCAEHAGIDLQTHWIERDADGNPGHFVANDAPVTSKAYDTTERAKAALAEAQKLTGTRRHDAICKGMAALRRTVEEAVVKRLFKGVVPRWSDRVIVTALKKVAWDERLADELVTVYEELSAYIEGHSHTDEAQGAPPEIKDLQKRIEEVDALLRRAKTERSAKSASGAPSIAPSLKPNGKQLLE